MYLQVYKTQNKSLFAIHYCRPCNSQAGLASVRSIANQDIKNTNFTINGNNKKLKLRLKSVVSHSIIIHQYLLYCAKTLLVIFYLNLICCLSVFLHLQRRHVQKPNLMLNWISVSGLNVLQFKFVSGIRAQEMKDY